MLENILNRAACKVIVMHASQHTGDTIHEQYRRVLESSRFRWFQAFSRILQILNAVADTKPPGASTFSVCGSFAAYLFEINTYLGAYPKWTPNDIDIFISDAPTSSSHYQLVKAISEAITRVLQTSLTGDASILATIKRASKYGNLGLVIAALPRSRRPHSSDCSHHPHSSNCHLRIASVHVHAALHWRSQRPQHPRAPS